MPYKIELPQYPSNVSADVGSTPSLKSILEMVYRRFWLIVLGGLTTFFLIAFVTFTQTPIYKAKATVIVDTSERNVIDLGSVTAGISSNTAVIDTEVEVMGSKSLLTRVVQDQNLVEDPEFNIYIREPDDGLVTTVKKSVKGLLGKETEVIDPFEGMTEEQKQTAILQKTTDMFARNVSVSRVGTTFLINTEVTSTNAQKAADLANAIADQYRVDQLEAKLDATQRANEWLAKRVEGLRDEVNNKERAVEEFRSASGLLAAAGSTLTERELSDLTAQRVQVEQNYSLAKARYDNVQSAISRGAGVESIAEVLSNPVIAELKSQRAAVLRRQADLQATYGPSHPEMLRVRSEAADIDSQIRAEVNRIVANLESEMQVARNRLNKLNGEIGGVRSRLIGNNKSQVRLNELERDAETSRILYEDFVNRYKQTREQDDLAEADARVLSSASVPQSPSTPKTMLNLVLGVLLGGIVGIGLALLADMFDNKISSTDDVENKLGGTSLGTIPMIPRLARLGTGEFRPADYLLDNPLSAYAESIRYLRASIAFSDLDSETKTVAITSSLPDEGKTSLTLSLGRMSALSGSRTLVIDGDFRRRQLTDAAGLKPETGFIEYLFGEGDLQSAIHRDPKSTLDVLPLTRTGHTPHDVFGTHVFDQLLATLRETYDLILIDTGPLLLMAEARVIVGKVDKAILAVRWRHTTRGAVKQSMQILKSFKADVLGVTLNMVDLSRRRHNGDQGAGYRDYRKYYQMDSKIRFGRSKNKVKVVPAPTKTREPARSGTTMFRPKSANTSKAKPELEDQLKN